MIPLRIEIDLATPWVPPTYGVHLDGLIAWAVADQCMTDPDCTQAAIDAAVDALPLARHVGQEGGWCWKASLFTVVDPGRLHRHFATAKTDAGRMASGLVDGLIRGKKTVDLVRGMSKSDLYRFTTQNASQLHAWCVGDEALIAQLLSRVQHVGGRGRLGFGAIRRNSNDEAAIRVIPDDTKRDGVFRWERRHQPEPPKQTGFVPIEGRCIPPYWHSAAGQRVWRPVDA